MDVFKLHHADVGEIPLTRKNFETLTRREKPWFVREDGEQRYFSVCPACDNTIQIIRLYDAEHKPFGKHYLSRHRDDLGIFSVDHYDTCPYAAKNKSQRPDKDTRRKESVLTKKIKTLLTEQFDRVIYVLEKQLDMRFSQKLARDILLDYISASAWQYYAATVQNIPWMFLYFGLSQPMFGRCFRNPALQQAVSARYPEAEWHNNILRSRGGYISPRFCFLLHRRVVTEHHLEETITFSVSDNKQNVIFEQVIPVEGSYFVNLIAKTDDSYRKPQWVEFARSVFSQAEKDVC